MHFYFADGQALFLVTGGVRGVYQHLEIGDQKCKQILRMGTLDSWNHRMNVIVL